MVSRLIADKFLSPIAEEYYNDVQPRRGVFDYHRFSVQYINDGLKCATPYCRYLPINTDLAYRRKIPRPSWIRSWEYPPFRFESFIVPRGDVLLEFDNQWLGKKLHILEVEFERRMYYRWGLRRAEATEEWVEEAFLPLRIAICTAVLLTKAMYLNKPINKPWRHTSAKEEWARIVARGYLDPDDGYSISIFDDLTFPTDNSQRKGWDMDLIFRIKEKRPPGQCMLGFLSRIWSTGKDWDRHRRVLNTSVHFGQAVRGLRDRPFDGKKGLARPEAHHMATFLMDLIRRRRQKLASEERPEEQVKREMVDEKSKEK